MLPRRFLNVVLAAVITIPAIAGAQVATTTNPALSAGDTLRVWGKGRQLQGIVGSLDRLDARELVMTKFSRYGSSASAVTIPFDALVQLEVQRGRHSSAGRGVAGFALGLLAGAVAGAMLAEQIMCRGGSCEPDPTYYGTAGMDSRTGARLGGALLGGVAGSVAGSVIGLRPHPRWEKVALHHK